MSPKGPRIKHLIPGVALLGGGGVFSRRIALVGNPQVTGDVFLKGTVGSWLLLPLFASWPRDESFSLPCSLLLSLTSPPEAPILTKTTKSKSGNKPFLFVSVFSWTFHYTDAKLSDTAAQGLLLLKKIPFVSRPWGRRHRRTLAKARAEEHAGYSSEW